MLRPAPLRTVVPAVLAALLASPATASSLAPLRVPPTLGDAVLVNSDSAAVKRRAYQRKLRKQRQRARQNADFAAAAEMNQQQYQELGDRYGAVEKSALKARLKLKALRKRTTDKDLDSATREVIGDLRQEGGDYMVTQLDLSNINATLDRGRNLDAEARSDLQRQADALRKKLAAQRAKMQQAGETIRKLRRKPKMNTAEALDMLKAKNTLEDLGGDLEVDALDAETDLARLARQAGFNRVSPLLARHVPVGDAVAAQPLRSQGKDMICGYKCVQMAAGSRLGRVPNMKQLMGRAPFRRDRDTGAVAGLDQGQIVDLMGEVGVPAQSANFAAKTKGARQMQAALTGDPGAGPFIVGIDAAGSNATLAATADGNNQTKMEMAFPGGLSPALRAGGINASGKNRYKHWVVVDGVQNVPPRGAKPGAKGEPHFVIRDPDGGNAMFYSVEDFGDLFDGNAIQPQRGS